MTLDIEDEITVEFARSIGLIPEVYGYDYLGDFIFPFWPIVRRVSEETYRRRDEEIRSKFITNEKLGLCRFPVAKILEAVKNTFPEAK